jgi:dihydroneopterin aldolase
MTEATIEVNLCVQVDVYPDEFRPIMKALKYATLCEDRDQILDDKELTTLEAFLDHFSVVARNCGA